MGTTPCFRARSPGIDPTNSSSSSQRAGVDVREPRVTQQEIQKGARRRVTKVKKCFDKGAAAFLVCGNGFFELLFRHHAGTHEKLFYAALGGQIAQLRPRNALGPMPLPPTPADRVPAGLGKLHCRTLPS